MPMHWVRPPGMFMLLLLWWAGLEEATAAAAELGRSRGIRRSVAVRGAARGAASPSWSADEDAVATRLATKQDLRSLMFEVTREGIVSARLLDKAADNETWQVAHGEELAASVRQLAQAWARVQRLATTWKAIVEATEAAGAVQLANDTHETGPTPDPGRPIPDTVTRRLFFLYFVAFIFTLVLFCKSWRDFDLLSPQIVSRIELAASFSSVSINTYVLFVLSAPEIGNITEWPTLLYFFQLTSCFVAVVLVVPMATANRRGAPLRLVILCQLLQAHWFFVNFYRWWFQPFSQTGNYIEGIGFVLTGIEFVASWQKVFVALGLNLRLGSFSFLPFYDAHERDCREYAQSRLGGDQSSKITQEPPANLPTVVMIAVFCTMAYMVLLSIQLLGWLGSSIPMFREQLALVMEVIEPLLALNGIELPGELIDAISALLDRVQTSITVGVLGALLYSLWLAYRVVEGYRHIFRKVVLRRRYKGRSILEQPGGAKAFHPMWATFFAGCFFGNTLVGHAVVLFLASLFSMILLTPQAWRLTIGLSLRYLRTPLFLYLTRTALFICVIPPYICTNEGVVLRPKLWAFMYPTLVLLNFILGALNGIIRFAVSFPIMLGDLFRMDRTFLHQNMVEWDWSYHAFLSMVIDSSKQLNPIATAVASELFKSTKNKREHLDERQPRNVDDPGAVADSGVELQDGATLQVPEEHSESRLRARKRWHLAITLAQNPSLQPSRRH